MSRKNNYLYEKNEILPKKVGVILLGEDANTAVDRLRYGLIDLLGRGYLFEIMLIWGLKLAHSSHSSV